MGRLGFWSVGIVLLSFLFNGGSSQPLPFQKGLPNSYAQTSADFPKTDFNDYIWPTDAGRLVSSVFAEYRRSHFHGGIDVSTGDETGFRVFASRVGYVAKIIVGPTGYGKMLWVRHNDGYYTTYAHLRNFNAALDARVLSEQLRLERFPVTIECLPSEFPVKKGDVIAFTGETGTGSPHLHFEIRDENEDFVNPFLCSNFSIDDDSIPRVEKIAFVPLSDESLIDGLPSPKVISIVNPIRSNIDVPEVIHVVGSVGISIDARDRINRSRFRNGVYSQQLFVDDSLVFSTKLDRAPSEHDNQVGLYFDHDLEENEEGRFARLYIETANPLLVYSPKMVKAGVLTSARFMAGIHTYRIVVRDFAGNSTELTGKIVFSQPAQFQVSFANNSLQISSDSNPAISEFAISSYSFGNTRTGWRPVIVQPVSGSLPPAIDLPQNLSFDVLRVIGKNQFGSPSSPRFIVRSRTASRTLPRLNHSIEENAIVLHLSTDEAFSSTPSIAVVEGSTTQRLIARALDYNSYVASFRPNESIAGKRTLIAECVVNYGLQVVTDSIQIYPILPDRKQKFSFAESNVVINTDSSVFKPTFLVVSPLANEENAFALRPRNTVLRSDLTVSMKKTDTDTKQGMYFRSRVSGWRLVATDSGRNYFQANLRRTLGEIAIKRDAQPPIISRLSLPSRSKRTQSISFNVVDSRSGVEYKELKLYIDNSFVVPEIDGEHRRVTYRFSEPLSRGSHKLRIVVKDRMGNTTNVTRTFTVR